MSRVSQEIMLCVSQDIMLCVSEEIMSRVSQEIMLCVSGLSCLPLPCATTCLAYLVSGMSCIMCATYTAFYIAHGNQERTFGELPEKGGSLL